MVFEWLGAYDCSTSFALRALSTRLCVKLHLSASRSRGSTGEYWRAAPARYWPHTQQKIHRQGRYSAGYSARSTGGLLWWDTWRDPATLAGYSAACTGATLKLLPGYSAGSTGGILGGIHWQAALVGYSAGSTDELLWRDIRRSTGELLWDTQRDTRRDP